MTTLAIAAMISLIFPNSNDLPPPRQGDSLVQMFDSLKEIAGNEEKLERVKGIEPSS
tara:strand:- start:21 stop:191 length:171 start_codon:yes stop_codon:yes gene_type:complete